MTNYLDLYNAGLSIRAIANQVNSSVSTIARSLKADPDYLPRAAGVRYASPVSEPIKRVSFHLEETLIEQIENLEDYPSRADFLRSAVKEKLERLTNSFNEFDPVPDPVTVFWDKVKLVENLNNLGDRR